MPRPRELAGAALGSRNAKDCQRCGRGAAQENGSQLARVNVVFCSAIQGDAKEKKRSTMTSAERRAVLSLLRLLSHGSNIGGLLGTRLAVWASDAKRVSLAASCTLGPLGVPTDRRVRQRHRSYREHLCFATACALTALLPRQDMPSPRQGLVFAAAVLAGLIAPPIALASWSHALPRNAQALMRTLSHVPCAPAFPDRAVPRPICYWLSVVAGLGLLGPPSRRAAIVFCWLLNWANDAVTTSPGGSAAGRLRRSLTFTLGDKMP